MVSLNTGGAKPWLLLALIILRSGAASGHISDVADKLRIRECV